MINAQIIREAKRFEQVGRDLMESCYERARDEELEDFKVDVVGVVAVVNWIDDEGRQIESTVQGFESRKVHVQSGILVQALIQSISGDPERE